MTCHRTSSIKLMTVFGWLFATSGCAITATQDDIDRVLTQKKGGIVVIGANADSRWVSPVDAIKIFSPRISVFTAVEHGNDISFPFRKSYNPFSLSNGFIKPTYSASVQDGYAVFTLPASNADESYVVVDYETGPGGRQIPMTCQERRTPTFKVKDGDVIYVGHYSVFSIETPLTLDVRISYRSDFQKAVNYVQRSYPAIATQLHPASPEFRVTKRFGMTCQLSIAE